MPGNRNTDRLPGVQRAPLPAIAALALGILAGVLIGALGRASIARQASDGFWAHFIERITGRALSINISIPAVVDRIQQLNRLETIVYTMDKVVEGDRQSLLLPDFLAGDKLILIAHGDVIAGIDLSHIGAESIHIDPNNGKQVHIHLPDAQIFVTRLDNANSRVYSRSTGFFVAADPNLETEVRRQAEEQIRQAALGDGILAKANANAATTLRTLLKNSGFEKVDFD